MGGEFQKGEQLQLSFKINLTTMPFEEFEKPPIPSEEEKEEVEEKVEEEIPKEETPESLTSPEKLRLKEVNLSALRARAISRYQENPDNIRESADQVMNLIKERLEDSPNTDLIITPEYSFYFNPDIFTPVQFQKNEEGKYEIAGGAEDIIERLRHIQELARKYKSNIILGTISEGEEIDKIPVWYNSAIVINNEGEIIQIRRKTSGSNALESPGNPKITLMRGKEGLETLKATQPRTKEDEISLKAYEKAVSTAKPIEINTKSGESFKILVLICGESRENEDLYQTNQNAEVDFVIQLSGEGDDFLTETFEYQQTGTAATIGKEKAQERHKIAPEVGWDKPGMIKKSIESAEEQAKRVQARPQWIINFLREKLLAHKVIKPGGMIVALDSVGQQASYFPISKEKARIKDYEIRKDSLAAHLLVE